MRRREFIAGLGAISWPLAARAQGERTRRIGVLVGLAENERDDQANLSALREGLAKLGWIEGRNVRIDVRFGAGEPDRIRAYAAELLALAPDVMFAYGGTAASALQQRTQTIPIVFRGPDPVGAGLARNITRPEGNITGFSVFEPSIVGKWLELLKRRRVGVLIGADENDPVWKTRLSAFTQALANLGWTESRNVRMDLRWHGDDTNQIRTLAQELVGLHPDIILLSSTAATVALQRETRTIPIVFANVTDPVASGIVARLDRPSGNITGFASFEATSGGKWLELLSEITPGLKRVARP
jgi:ABC-type uncharacterized transport system substrate-binding protein